jgi:hypothetical protein
VHVTGSEVDIWVCDESPRVIEEHRCEILLHGDPEIVQLASEGVFDRLKSLFGKRYAGIVFV